MSHLHQTVTITRIKDYKQSSVDAVIENVYIYKLRSDDRHRTPPTLNIVHVATCDQALIFLV